MKGHVMRDLEVNSSDIVNYPILLVIPESVIYV